MPRPKTFDLDPFLEACKEQVTEISSSLNRPSAEVWIKLSEILKFKYSAKYLYLIFKRNRYDVLNKLGIKKTETEDEIAADSIRSETADIDASSCDSDTSSTNEISKEFTITLSATEWDKISPKEVIYQSKDISNPSRLTRLYNVLPRESGWTSIINSHVWDHLKLGCHLIFLRNKVYETGGVFLKIEGKCTECQSKFVAQMKTAPSENGRALLNCSLSGNFDTCRSSKKRRLVGENKDAFLREFLGSNKTASCFRGQLVNQSMRDGDVEPCHIPTLHAMRKMKSRVEKKEKLDENPINALHIMMYTDPFSSCIHLLSVEPFMVHYWTNSQVAVFNNYCETTEVPSVCIDATGGIVDRLSRPFSNVSGEIFLYLVCVYEPKKRLQFPVCSMLSERHTTVAILHFMNSFFKLRNPVKVAVPKETICDHSIPILSAAVQCFTQFPSLADYIKNCSNLITDASKVITPTTFIRCDIAHTVKIIVSWGPFKGVVRRVKQFYVRAVCHIIQSTSMKDIEELLLSIFIVCLSPDEGNDESGAPLPCTIEKGRIRAWNALGFPSRNETPADFQAQRELEEILTMTEDSESQLADAEDTPGLDEESCTSTAEDSSESCVSFKEWGSSIVRKAEEEIRKYTSEEVNGLYLPKLPECVITLLETLPLWSGIMRPIFDFGAPTVSSAPVESIFNDIKNRLLGANNLKIRPDTFLMKHVPHIESSMKIRNARNITENQSETERLNQTRSQSQEDGNNLQSEKEREEEISSSASLKIVDQAENVGVEQVEGITDQSESNLPYTTPTSCPVCLNGDMPTGAHLCVSCCIPVHIISGCSVPIDASNEDEGYGQRALCQKCHQKSMLSPKSRRTPAATSSQGNLNFEVENNENNNESESIQSSNTEELILCPACLNGDLPTGAHKCASCGVPVHIISGCSVPLDASNEDEGYGQRALCQKCHQKSILSPKSRRVPAATSSQGNLNFEVENNENNNESESIQSSNTEELISCPACLNGDLPTGAHKCASCGVPVHIISGCSFPLGVEDEEEGYGQRALCHKCHLQKDKNVTLSRGSTNASGEESPIRFLEATAVENWRGKGLPIKKRPRHSYLIPNSELMNVDLSSKGKPLPIGLLKNGTRGTDLKPVAIAKKKYIVSNTCAFDSIIQTVACGYCDSHKYQEYVQSQPKEALIWRLVSHMNKLGMTKWPYRWRIEILKDLYTTEDLQGGISTIQAEIVAAHLCKKLFKEYPSITETKECSAALCSSKFPITNVDIELFEHEIGDLQSLVNNSIQSINEKCLKEANAMHETKFHVSSYHLFVELQLKKDFIAGEETDVGGLPELILSEIPKILSVNNSSFHLRGAICLSGVTGRSLKNIVGHYTSYCRRFNDYWEVYNDLSEKKKYCSEKTKLQCELLFYTI